MEDSDGSFDDSNNASSSAELGSSPYELESSPVSKSKSASKKGDSHKSVGKTIEQRYQKKTPVEHILHRPESYIGSIQLDQQTVWIWNEFESRMELKQIEFVPGLYKIFDEILVNAADVKAREEHESGKRKLQKMTTLKVDIDREAGTISVYNDGEGIPIEIHKEHSIYVPELIFGHLLTSDNYDDTEQRVTGGRNGYGAKLTNIFSVEFTVECADSKRKRKFKKKWRNNMSSSDPCKITEYKDSKDYVKITFKPDLTRFKIDGFSDDLMGLFIKRIYDVSGCCAIKVWFNGRRLPCNDFKSYVDLYFASQDPVKALTEGVRKPVVKIHEKAARWEIVISQSDGQFQQVSFVNAICTTKGGTHVNYVTDPLIQAILRKVATKNKGGMDMKAHHIKQHLWVFVNCLIVNPTFDSQTKDTLTLRASQFGSKFVISEKTLSAVVKSDIVESVLLWAKTKQEVELQRKMKGAPGQKGKDRVSGIPKLEDANLAGSRHADECTLILTEGESAKTSCVAGLSVVGKDKYGIFPLKGKLLNVREATFKQQIENQEIQAILKIMGLQVGKKIDHPKGLRYGSLMLMTDQDLDGSHIKGLLLNMVAHYWPNLLKVPGFLREFVTPIVKVWKSDSKESQGLSFFTLREYEDWKRLNKNGKGWRIKYYKGLGTSSNQEFMKYFSELERHTLQFAFESERDYDCIDMAFNGKRAEDRKAWIQQFDESTTEGIDHTKNQITYSDFVNKELVLFSRYDVVRSIPSCVDGLKPVQRKILFAAFKKPLKQEMKVAQFVGFAAGKSAYHHGEQSLGGTIVGMAQTFVGSNNVNLFMPCGQFGSRKEGGKDASAVRYIFTKLAPMARALFNEHDDPLLEYQNDDGLLVEPKYYVPVVPLALLNGAEGIGTGWSTSIPNFNARDVIANVRRFIRAEPMETLIPSYRGFSGTIERKGPHAFESVGRITKIDDQTVQITELPIKVWTQSYKTWLEELLTAGENRGSDELENNENSPPTNGTEVRGRGRGRGTTAAARSAATTNQGRGRGGSTTNSSFYILDYVDNCTHKDIDFTVKLSKRMMERAEAEGLEKTFRLRRPLNTSNMTLFDPTGKIQRYNSELDIIREFGQLRLQYYQLRREYLLEAMERERRILANKVKFIQGIVDGTLVINNRKKAEIIASLSSFGIDPLSVILKAAQLMHKLEQQRLKIESLANGEEQGENSEETVDLAREGSGADGPAKDFDYLLRMPLWTLTTEKIDQLKEELIKKLEQCACLQNKTPEDLWEEDLINLEAALDEQDRWDEAESADKLVLKERRQVSLKAKGKPRRAEPVSKGSLAKPTRKKLVQSKLTSPETPTEMDDDFLIPPKRVTTVAASERTLATSRKDLTAWEKLLKNNTEGNSASSRVTEAAEFTDAPSELAKENTNINKTTEVLPLGTAASKNASTEGSPKRFTLIDRLKAKGTSSQAPATSAILNQANNWLDRWAVSRAEQVLPRAEVEGGATAENFVTSDVQKKRTAVPTGRKRVQISESITSDSSSASLANSSSYSVADSDDDDTEKPRRLKKLRPLSGESSGGLQNTLNKNKAPRRRKQVGASSTSDEDPDFEDFEDVDSSDATS